MNEINFLPWRDEKRKQLRRQSLLVCLTILTLSSVAVCVVIFEMNQKNEIQRKRNSILKAERLKLSHQVEKVKQYEREIAYLEDYLLLSGSKVKNQIWQTSILEVLVSTLPSQVYLDSFESHERIIKVLGKARSNKEIEAMMNALKASKWVNQVEIKGIEMVFIQGQRLSQFELEIM